MIAGAVRAARGARVAVVFASVKTAEGSDRPTLALPGDENALIAAVAAVNPRTVVVLNTGGAVTMPWLSQVAAVLEAWYPGEGDGPATAAVLFGTVDPAGRLPITFPAYTGQTTIDSANAYPGVDATVEYSEDLDIGYRYVEAHHLEPLFPFGYGLSYTSFSLKNLSLTRAKGSVEVTVQVTNTGRRSGTDVVECYLRYPAAADEPPEQLRAFSTTTLEPGESRVVRLSLDRSAFTAYLNGRFRTVSGNYEVALGTSSANLVLKAVTSAPS
jgi:beta-glucosidase